MNDINEFYDTMADISDLVREAIKNVELAKEKVQLALRMINNVKKCGGNTIAISSSPISITTNDVHRNLLFFELLLNQTQGVTNTFTFEELLELTNYFVDEEEF